MCLVSVQVGKEKANVALENEAAQVEADKCAVIAKDVSELAARCEADLAAAEPLVAQAEAALDTLNKKDLGEFFLLPRECMGLKGNPLGPTWATLYL